MKFLIIPKIQDLLTMEERELIENSLYGADNLTIHSIHSILDSVEAVTQKSKDTLYEYAHWHMTAFFDRWMELASRDRTAETEAEKAERNRIWHEMGKWRVIAHKIQAVTVK